MACAPIVRWLVGIAALAGAAVASADPDQKLDLSVDIESLHLEETYLEEIVVTGEPWREPARDEDEWRPKTRTWETGRITWGYDSAYDEMNYERDSRLYVTGPSATDELPTSTIFRVRF